MTPRRRITWLERRYFISPVRTLRATISICCFLVSLSSVLRHTHSHLISQISGTFSVSLTRYRCHDCSLNFEEYFTKLRTSQAGRLHATRGVFFERPLPVFAGSLRITFGLVLQICVSLGISATYTYFLSSILSKHLRSRPYNSLTAQTDTWIQFLPRELLDPTRFAASSETRFR